MVIERSSDYGKTWKAYRYFAYDCRGSFPDIPNQRPTTHSEVICTEKYSNVAPSTGGEVIFRRVELFQALNIKLRWYCVYYRHTSPSTIRTQRRREISSPSPTCASILPNCTRLATICSTIGQRSTRSTTTRVRAALCLVNYPYTLRLQSTTWLCAAPARAMATRSNACLLATAAAVT